MHIYIMLPFRKRHLQAEREKAEMPNFGPTIIPEPDPTPPSTPIGICFAHINYLCNMQP